MSRAWVMFWVVAVIWGSSFILIRVGVEVMSAAQVVFIRCAVAAVGLNAVLLLRGKRLPLDMGIWRKLIIVGVFNATVPYMLISLSEQRIPSNVASVLQSTTALFAMILAHLFIADDRITWRKAAGIGLGFVGVLLLASRPSEAATQQASILGIIGMLLGSLSYSATTVYTRRSLGSTVEPLVIAAGSFIVAAICGALFLVLEPALGGQAGTPLAQVPSDALLAVLGLGFFNTFIAYLFFYYLIQTLGASRTTMVTYVVPAIGLLLGSVILGESLDAVLLFGALLIFAGIAVANLRVGHWVQRLRPASRAV
ncbi:MAG: EamA family transporter [Armatimonadetes bacterium]|nr:EamA family transporter [Anaerolineae bacterium]